MKLNILILCFGFTLLATCTEARGNSKKLAGRRRKSKARLTDGVSEENENHFMANVDSGVPDMDAKSPVGMGLDTETKKRKSKKSNRQKGGSQKSSKKQRRRKSKKNQKGSTALEEDQKEKLRLTMREMFGFDHMTTPRAATQLSLGIPQPTLAAPMLDILENDDMDFGGHYQPQLPNFMLQLYRAYSEDSSLVLLNSMSRGNTIRSFFSVAGHPANLRNQAKPMLIEPITLGENASRIQQNHHERSPNIAVYTYNVSTIPLTEKVVSAELRIDRTDVDRPSTNWTVMVGVYKRQRGSNNESLNLFHLVGDLTKINTTTGSAWTEVSLSKLVSLARQPDHVFVVKFSKRENRVARFRRSIFPKSKTVDLPASFKMLKTNRARRNSGKNRNNRANGYTFEEESTAQFGVPILVVYCNDTTAVVQTPIQSLQNGIWDSMGNKSTSLRSTGSKRLRRSTKRRRPDNGSALPSTDQMDNQISDSNETPKASTIENDQTELHDNGEANRKVMQSLATSKHKKNRRQRKRKCKKRGRNRKSKKCKKERSKNRRKNLSETLNRSDKVCSRKSLRVDFADLGWADWIISPQQFDAYYCSGVCELETIRDHSPSNHAIIQSVIKEFDLNDEIPSPCCVPDKMMSLSVLFFDKDESVVLKLYPGMSVESCSCR